MLFVFSFSTCEIFFNIVPLFFYLTGTPRDYFREIRKRSETFPTFKGDFFVYSDIFSEGRPAYWSGYFTTRPFYKILSADMENNLRAAEILFTIAYNTARQYHHENAIKIYEKNYEKMILARRNLGLFQHHDAITGTSKAAVMRDYGMRLYESIQDVVKMQASTIELLIQNGTSRHNFLLSELERDNYSKLPRKTPVALGTGGIVGDYSSEPKTVTADTTHGTTEKTKIKFASFVIFNSLTQQRLEVITIRTLNAKVRVLNEHDEEIKHLQINPVWNITDIYDNGGGIGGTGSSDRIRVSAKQYEVMFVASLEPLSLTTFKVVSDDVNYKRSLASIYCDDCTDKTTPTTDNNVFVVRSKPAGKY